MRRAALALLVLAGAVWSASAPPTLLAQRPVFLAAPSPATEALELIPVQGKVWLLAGAGGNIAVQVGDDGIVLVDTGLEAFSQGVLDTLARLTDRPVRMIINTGTALDHIGGNDAISRTGQGLYVAANSGAVTFPEAQIVGHERAVLHLSRLTGAQAVPQRQWPFDTFFGDLKTVVASGEPIEIHHLPAARTDGDLMVFFRGSDVVAAGDVFDTTGYPRIDADAGGTIQGVLDALNRIIRITVPTFNQMGGTRVIPGHGRISNESDVVEYRDMVTIVRDRIRLLVEAGTSLAEVRSAGVTRDYDGIYGSTTGPWTTDMFVEAVYREEVRRAGGR